jgi:hypothetical protein
MDKKQLIEIICVIAGVSLAIKAIDYLQFFITMLFQLIRGHGYVEFYYFFIYLTTIIVYVVLSYLLVSRANGLAEMISRKLGPSDMLIDLNGPTALEYALIVIGGLSFITGLSAFLSNVVTSVTMQGELIISGNMIWLNGLIRIIIGLLLIFRARSIGRLIRRDKNGTNHLRK